MCLKNKQKTINNDNINDITNNRKKSSPQKRKAAEVGRNHKESLKQKVIMLTSL